jgi:hypothetical protein
MKLEEKVHKKNKALAVTGRGGPYGCETLRIAHFLDSRLRDCCGIVSLTNQPRFTPRKIPEIHLPQRLCQPQGHSAAGRIL